MSVYKNIFLIVVMQLLNFGGSAQNNALILNGAVYVTLNGGTSGTPVRLIINQPNAIGIERLVADNGWIISEGEFNYVQWNLATSTGNYVIPYNYSSTDIPFTMDITSAGVGGTSVLFSTYHTAASDNLPIPTYDGTTTIPDINNQSGANNSPYMPDRWWIVDATGYATKPAATLTFSYVETEWTAAVNTITEANLQAQSYNTTLTPNRWVTTDLFGTDVPLSNYVNVATIPADKLFRAWVLVDNTSPLPIELLSFNAVCENNGIILNWSTASEINNDYFTIERCRDEACLVSTNNNNWEIIGNIGGAGNSSTILYYEFIDNELPPATATATASVTFYYRLSQTDFNGDEQTFQIVSANCSGTNEVEVNLIIINNPAHETVQLLLTGKVGNKYVLSFIDQLGRQLIQKQISLENTNQSITINTQNLSEGIYSVVYRSNNNIITKQLIITK